MKISEHIKGSDYDVIIVDNIIPNLEVYDIDKWFEAEQFNFKFPGHHDHFILRQYTANQQVIDIGKELYSELKQIIDIPNNTYMSSGTHELRWHESGVGAVPPHDDINHYAGITIFLNRQWKLVWGGWNICLSLIEDRPVKVTIPKFNSAVIVRNRTMHCATPVFENRVRRTLQYFITYEKNTN